MGWNVYPDTNRMQETADILSIPVLTGTLDQETFKISANTKIQLSYKCKTKS